MKWRVIDMTIDEAEKIKTVIENKDYIAQLVKVVAKVIIEAFENLKIEDVNMFQLGYNKAIDDFVKMLYEKLLYEDGLTEIDVDYIAEQLKAGGKDE